MYNCLRILTVCITLHKPVIYSLFGVNCSSPKVNMMGNVQFGWSRRKKKLQNLSLFDCLMFSSLTVFLPDSFCLSLQLEVLHSQTLMLIRERWGDLVQEERYVPAKYLTLSVWKYARLP